MRMHADHDVVATVDGDDDLHEADIITLSNDRGMTADMRLHRLISDGPSSCPSPVVVNTPLIDAGVVYGEDAAFLKETLRLPDSCMLRTSGSSMLPISTVANADGTYVFIAGDARVDEHAVLTMMHTVWMREHNRLCDFMNKDSAFAGLSNEAKFQRARNVRTSPSAPRSRGPTTSRPPVPSQHHLHPANLSSAWPRRDACCVLCRW